MTFKILLLIALMAPILLVAIGAIGATTIGRLSWRPKRQTPASLGAYRGRAVQGNVLGNMPLTERRGEIING